jgi:hypothetical protein
LPPLEGETKNNYDSGKLLFGDGDFAGALIKFKAAYDATKDPRPLWNMAACEKNLRHYARAVALVTLYLADDRIGTDDRADAQRLKTTLADFTVPMVITVTEPGADVLIDGESIGQSPLPGPVTLDIGARKLQVRKAGFKAFETPVVVAPGNNAPVVAKLDLDVHQGHLVVKGPAGASIAIDGQPMAMGSWEGMLPSGGHSLRVSATGMRSYQDEVTLMDDQTRTLDITLEAESSGASKWLWIAAGGAVVAAGAAVGGYFLLKKSEPASQTPGTIDTVPLP